MTDIISEDDARQAIRAKYRQHLAASKAIIDRHADVADWRQRKKGRAHSGKLGSV